MTLSFTEGVKEALQNKQGHFSSAFLVVIKAVHTLIWAFFVACIFGVWAYAWCANFLYALILIGVICLEVLVLALNSGRCPISGLARRLTSDPSRSFDIFLPAGLAGHTKPIFGSLFLGGVLITALRWGFSP